MIAEYLNFLFVIAGVIIQKLSRFFIVMIP